MTKSSKYRGIDFKSFTRIWSKLIADVVEKVERHLKYFYQRSELKHYFYAVYDGASILAHINWKYIRKNRANLPELLCCAHIPNWFAHNFLESRYSVNVYRGTHMTFARTRRQMKAVDNLCNHFALPPVRCVEIAR